MKTRLLIFLVLTLILPSLILSAQESTAEATSQPDTEGWPVVQRCVGEPTTPPDDWTYDGTILMTGWAGVHAINSNREVPYIVAPVGIPGGALSPNGDWFASPEGEIRYSYTTADRAYEANRLGVYSTTLPIQEQAFDWNVLYFGFTPDRAVNSVVWLDDERFIYYMGTTGSGLNSFIVNVATRDIVDWTDETPFLDTFHASTLYPSPDLTRIIQGSNLYEFTTGDLLKDNLPASQVVWNNNSTEFIMLSDELSLFSHDGELLQTIYSVEGETGFFFPYRQVYPNLNVAWSIDARFIAFQMYSRGYRKLLVADLTERNVIDLCLMTSSGVAWSNNGHQLVVLAPIGNQRPL